MSAARNPRADLVDLLKYTEYMVYVTASTNAGEGPRSANVVIKTSEDGKRQRVVVSVASSVGERNSQTET